MRHDAEAAHHRARQAHKDSQDAYQRCQSAYQYFQAHQTRADELLDRADTDAQTRSVVAYRGSSLYNQPTDPFANGAGDRLAQICANVPCSADEARGVCQKAQNEPDEQRVGRNDFELVQRWKYLVEGLGQRAGNSTAIASQLP